MSFLNTSTKIGNINLSNPLMNASGPLCTDEKHLSNLNLSSSGAFITKSITLQKREGNSKPK